jgi:hypothetical protein
MSLWRGKIRYHIPTLRVLFERCDAFAEIPLPGFLYLCYVKNYFLGSRFR